MKFTQNLLICSFVFVMFFQGSAQGFWGGSKHKTKIREAFIGSEIVIIPQENKIHTGFGSFSAGDFYYVKSLDKIFFRDEEISVSIKEIDFDDETITANLFHPKYGFGDISFIFSEEQYENTDVEKFREVLESSLVRPDLGNVVVNHKTGKYHLPSSNHHPLESSANTVSRALAEQEGMEPCGFCFKHFIYLPDYKLEQMMARNAAADRVDHQIAVDSSLHPSRRCRYVDIFGNWFVFGHDEDVGGDHRWCDRRNQRGDGEQEGEAGDGAVADPDGSGVRAEALHGRDRAAARDPRRRRLSTPLPRR